MQCEVCGGEIRGKPVEIVVEGSVVNACQRCRRFGSEPGKWRPFSLKHSPEKKAILPKRKRTPKIDIEEEVVPDYNEIIKRERERRGWTQEKLAKKINEKVSLIGKIERAEIVPEPRVIKKIEQLFNIKLTEKVQDVEITGRKGDVTPTLGDIAIIKRK